MDVLVVAAYPSRDEPAASRFVADQAAALQQAGVTPWVATFDRLHLAGDAWLRDRQESAIRGMRSAALGDGTKAAVDPFRLVDGIRVARLATANGPDRKGDAASGAHRRAEALRDLIAGPANRPWDLVHAHMGYPDGAAAADVAAALGVPLVITEHASFVGTNLADPAKGTAYRAAFGAAARVIAVSDMLRGELAAAIPEAAGKLRVIPNAVAVAEFPLVGPDARDGDELLYVGYRKATKGIALLLDAMAIVHRQRPEVRLRMIGSAPSDAEERSWRDRVAALGLVGVVALEPSAERPAVAAAMARAGVLVQPSPRETFGIVAAEALASGMPVVAVDSGGVTEIMAPDPSALGALVPNAADDLAGAILATLDRRASFDPAALRAHVERRYAASAVAGRIVELYRELVPQERAAVPGAAALPARRLWARPPVVVVGVQRPILDRMLAAMPTSVVEGATVVTSGGKADGLVIADVDPKIVTALGRWGSPGGTTTGPRVRRLVARLARPAIQAYRRRRFTDTVLGAVRAAVADAAGTHGSTDGETPIAVCLGGLDALAVAPLVASGVVRPCPGGLRWLADAMSESEAESEAEGPVTPRSRR